MSQTSFISLKRLELPTKYGNKLELCDPELCQNNTARACLLLSDGSVAISDRTRAHKKEERKASLMKDTIPFYMKKFEKIVRDNDGFAVGNSVTWADFVFAVSLENFELIFGKDSLKPYPNLRALKEKIFALPRIQAWIETRPQTEF